MGKLNSTNVLIRQVWADKKFFERNPDRRHRVRRVSRLERTEFKRGTKTYYNTPPGLALLAAIARPRLIALFVAASSLDTNLPEADCANLFEWAMPRGPRQIRALLLPRPEDD